MFKSLTYSFAEYFEKKNFQCENKFLFYIFTVIIRIIDMIH